MAKGAGLYPDISKKARGKGEVIGARKFGAEIGQNRRALSVINQNLEAKPHPCVANRRVNLQKLAAEIANKKQCLPEEIKRSNEGLVVWEDEVEEQDEPVPMFLETSEAMLDQTDHDMEEAEMGDIFEEAVIDIDVCDNGNQLAVVEYVEDLFAHYRKMELIKLFQPFWKVTSEGHSKGYGIVGVLEANFIEPAHEKQDFERSSLFSRLETKLKQMQMDYWKHHCHLIGHRPDKGFMRKMQQANPVPLQTQDERLDRTVSVPDLSGSQLGTRVRTVYNNDTQMVRPPPGFHTVLFHLLRAGYYLHKLECGGTNGDLCNHASTFPIRTIYFESPSALPEINSFTYETASRQAIICIINEFFLLSP